MTSAKNVLGTPLQPCSTAPMTGYFRTGCCDTGPGDVGVHVVCAVMTEEFLAFTVAVGNDLVTPSPGAARGGSLVPVRQAMAGGIRGG
jgi:uncharacterized protein (DUF2237 family)